MQKLNKLKPIYIDAFEKKRENTKPFHLDFENEKKVNKRIIECKFSTIFERKAEIT